MFAAAHPDTPLPIPLEDREQAVAFHEVSLGFYGKPVLEGVSFHLHQGETKVLLGVSGAGKSTLLKLVLGLVRPDAGRIFVLGQEVNRLREQELYALRRNIGMVFQESALFDSLTVRENVAFRLLEERTIPPGEIEERVREVLRFVELEDTLDMMPAELSGGMRRRVAIARALITRPEILLYDSPTGGLDPVTSNTIMELIVKQRDVYRSSSLLVTHRLQDAVVLATYYFDSAANQMRPVEPGAKRDMHTSFAVLRDGHVLFDGTAAELAGSDNPYLREYITV
jgi:phospholipid/cholesterol/gamma-HCH transport system ATP-binding protein